MVGENTSGVAPGEMACPDPSVHDHHHKLSEQASTAALYVTHPERHTEVIRETRENPLGPDGKLSSKGAAASLKYARAQDLPSFPSNGLAADSAGKAAMMAKDYKMKELWQPEASAAGSRAAFVAAGKGGKVDIWQPSASSNSNSAATLAMRNKTLSPKADLSYADDAKTKALLAATMSHSKGRERATSTPMPPAPAYPDSRNAVVNALNAATVSHRGAAKTTTTTDGWDAEANQAARIKNLGSHMDKAMFSDRPPVDIEVEEAKHKAALRASAVSMAKQMYDYQAQKDANAAAAAADLASGTAGAEVAASRNVPVTTQPDIKEAAMRYVHLQDAAHKLAAERLAKVDKNFEDQRYREYYGYNNNAEGKIRRRLSQRLSVRSGRKRASSEGTADQDDSDDEVQARRIRSQMSQLQTGVTNIDSRKQQDDRARLLAAAEKRVSARMQNMDERVFAETGKVSPAMMEEWEAKARKRAQEEREQQNQHPGQTHIGGGKFMTQADIEAIAAARLKPTLDEINDTAEKRRARDEEIRLEKEEQERLKREEKAKQREEKEEHRRIKSEEKAVLKQEKDAEKARKDEEKAILKREKDEEKARRDEEKRIAKEEKRKSRDVKRDEQKDIAAAVAGGTALAEVADKVKDDVEDPATTEAVQKHRSALGRLRDRFRRDHDDDEAPEDERPQTGHSGKAALTAVAGGAAAGVVADELADEDKHAETPASAVVQPVVAEPAAIETAPPGEYTAETMPQVVPMREPTSSVDVTTTIAPVIIANSAEEFAAITTAPTESVGDEVENRKEPELPGTSHAGDYAIGAGSGAAAVVAAADALHENDAEEQQVPERENALQPSAAGIDSTTDKAAIPIAPTIVEDLEQDDSVESLPPPDPSRPTFEQQPSLSGLYNDAFPTLAANERPDLERHISQIPENDDDDVDDSENDDIALATQNVLLERRLTRELAEQEGEDEDPESHATENATESASALPIPQRGAEDAYISSRRDDLVEPVGVLVNTNAGVAPGAMLIERDDPALGLLGLGAAGSAGLDTLRSNERIDDILDQQPQPSTLIPEPIETLNSTNETAAETTIPTGVESTDMAQPRAGATTAPNVASLAIDSTRKTDSVDLDQSARRKKQTGTGSATIETNKLKKGTEETSEKERHGFRGFINRITHRHSKSENKLQAVSYDTHKTAGKPDSSDTTGYTTHRGEDSTTAARDQDAGAAGSLSSFRRGEADPNNAEDVSSSGADEDDLARGRGRGGFARKLGFGGKSNRQLLQKEPPSGVIAAQEQAAAGDRQASYATDENEQYEEARDHFDESLAPPPAFAGQRRSESPVRETKFQEQL